ncbi:curli assembly protein CsgF [Dokdonia sp. R86516]|uniref:curli assembly protein CsgF n=1 Tax=Dokdonia sp. R86516 TaxID=3093856 RepID=UPI0037CB57CE
MRIFCFLVLVAASSFSYAQQFSYKPINPFFGGDTFNYQQLITSATAQNSLTAPLEEVKEQSELEQFGKQLSQDLLNTINSQLAQQRLDNLNITEEGTFTFGNLNVEVFETFDGLVINILDTTNGEETQIIVPN